MCVQVSNVNFVPSVDDVLLTRVRTTGIIEDHFIIEGKQIDVIDVGGQRNERRKWIHWLVMHALTYRFARVYRATLASPESALLFLWPR